MEVLTRPKPDFGNFQSLIKNVLIRISRCVFFLGEDSHKENGIKPQNCKQKKIWPNFRFVLSRSFLGCFYFFGRVATALAAAQHASFNIRFFPLLIRSEDKTILELYNMKCLFNSTKFLLCKSLGASNKLSRGITCIYFYMFLLVFLEALSMESVIK